METASAVIILAFSAGSYEDHRVWLAARDALSRRRRWLWLLEWLGIRPFEGGHDAFGVSCHCRAGTADEDVKASKPHMRLRRLMPNLS